MFYRKPNLERHFLDSLVNVEMFFSPQFVNMNVEWYDLYESEIVKYALFHAQQIICFKELRHTAVYGFHAGWSVVHLDACWNAWVSVTLCWLSTIVAGPLMKDNRTHWCSSYLSPFFKSPVLGGNFFWIN